MTHDDIEKTLKRYLKYDQQMEGIAPGARAELYEILEILQVEEPETMDRRQIAEQATIVVLERVKCRTSPRHPDSMYRERIAEIVDGLEHPLMMMMLVEHLAETLRYATQDTIDALDELLAIIREFRSAASH